LKASAPMCRGGTHIVGALLAEARAWSGSIATLDGA